MRSLIVISLGMLAGCASNPTQSTVEGAKAPQTAHVGWKCRDTIIGSDLHRDRSIGDSAYGQACHKADTLLIKWSYFDDSSDSGGTATIVGNDTTWYAW